MSKRSRARKYRRTRKTRNPRQLEIGEEVWFTYPSPRVRIPRVRRKTYSAKVRGYVIDIEAGRVSQYRIMIKGDGLTVHRSDLVSIFGGRRKHV